MLRFFAFIARDVHRDTMNTPLPERYGCVISTKQILLLLAPAPLRIVRRPSVTVTVDVPSIQRVVVVGVPVTVRTPSTVIRNTLSKAVASPDTTRTTYVPLGTAISHTASGTANFCRWFNVSYR